MTTPALPLLLLGGRDFSVAELSSARLDGEVTAVGQGFVPVGSAVDARHRAAALLSDVPPGYTVVGRSAAWVHGATARCPVPVEVGGPGPGSRWERPYRSVRTIRIRADHRIGVPVGRLVVPVLSPTATVIDLARIGAGDDDLAVMRSVILHCRIDPDGLRSALADWSHLPGKRTVAARVEEALVSPR